MTNTFNSPYTIKKTSILAFTVVLVSFLAVDMWLEIKFSSTWTAQLLKNIILTLPFIWGCKYITQNTIRNNKWVAAYICWVCIVCIIGLFECYSKNNLANFLVNTPGTILIISCLYIAKPNLLLKIATYWKYYSLPLLIIIIITCKINDVYGFYLCFLQIYLLFFKTLNRKSKIITLLLLLFILFFSLEARSHIIKYGIAFIIGLLAYIKTNRLIFIAKIGRIFCLIVPIFFFILGVTKTFNIFEIGEQNGSNKNEALADTRTFIYVEAITSALTNHYLWQGRTPAHGYDSYFQVGFFEEAGNIAKKDTVERTQSEVSIINIFTWYGAIGVFLYYMLFWTCSKKAIYQSNNKYIILVGLYLAFRWTYAWIEDFNSLDSSNIVLWIIISLSILPYFRKMSNNQIEDIFNKKIAL